MNKGYGGKGKSGMMKGGMGKGMVSLHRVIDAEVMTTGRGSVRTLGTIGTGMERVSM